MVICGQEMFREIILMWGSHCKGYEANGSVESLTSLDSCQLNSRFFPEGAAFPYGATPRDALASFWSLSFAERHLFSTEPKQAHRQSQEIRERNRSLQSDKFLWLLQRLKKRLCFP